MKRALNVIIVFICVCLLLIAMASDARAESGNGFDIGPFSLPNCEPGEVRFEEPRDIQRIVVTFKGAAPKNAGLSYMHKIWPSKRVERDYKGVDNAMGMGWYSIEDWFNCTWQKASVNVKRKGESALEITFKGLTSEYPDHQDYDVTYRRTQGFRIEADSPGDIKKVEAFTTSTPVKTTIRVHLNAGVKSGFDHISVTGYNATISKVKALSGVTVSKSGVAVGKDKNPEFEVQVTHMTPAHRFSGDSGCVTFSYGSDAFTISLAEKGPIWFADKGVYITFADDKTTFQDYQAQNAGKKTISQQVAAMREQSLG
ncbi:MAG: hypothetical protein WCL39_06500, partial [Armatimonadota bacterium]